jgi:enamine deaminase RidA (YjgF/YER057c/UK114 family)
MGRHGRVNEIVAQTAAILVSACKPTVSRCQSRLAWQKLEAELKAAGMTLGNLVKITTILPNHGDMAAAREARSKMLGDRKPASTLIVGGLATPPGRSRSTASPSLDRGEAHACSKAEMDIDWTMSTK